MCFLPLPFCLSNWTGKYSRSLVNVKLGKNHDMNLQDEKERDFSIVRTLFDYNKSFHLEMCLTKCFKV